MESEVSSKTYLQDVNAAGTEVLSMDCQEATDRLRTAERVLGSFRKAFLDARARSGGVWRLHAEAPFARLDAFLARCRELFELKQAGLQFAKLERVEIGGTKVRAPLLLVTPLLMGQATSALCCKTGRPGTAGQDF